MQKLSIIIPAMNEQDGISPTLDGIPISELKSLGVSVEAIVVDGGSTDLTVEMARARGTRTVVETRNGYGRAIKTGIEMTDGEFIAVLDADNSYPASAIVPIIRALVSHNLDMVTTSRLEKLSPGSMTPLHLLGNRLLSLATQLLFRIRLNDSQSGMWVARRDRMLPIELFSDGMAFSQEVKIRHFIIGKCLEVPIEYHARIGQAKLEFMRDGMQNLAEIIRLRRSVSAGEERQRPAMLPPKHRKNASRTG